MGKIKNLINIKKQFKIINKNFLGAAVDSKYFCINQTTMSNVLFSSATSLPPNFAGWRIKYFGSGKITFTPVSDTGNELSNNVGTLEPINYTFHVNNSLVPNGQILEEDFFPDLVYTDNTTVPIGFYFLNKSEYDIAYGVGIDEFCFSISYIFVNNTYVNTSLPILVIPMLKIECKYSVGGIFGPPNFETPDSPSILLAPPCPPIWKPGFTYPQVDHEGEEGDVIVFD